MCPPPPPTHAGARPRQKGAGAATAAGYLETYRADRITFTVVGTNDGPLGPFPATGKQFALGDLYYDQVSLLMQSGLMPQPSGA